MTDKLMMFSGNKGGKLNLIFEGDSITAGNNVGENEDYPFLTFRNFAFGKNSYYNLGLGSDTAANMDTNKASIFAKFKTGFTNIVILLAGTNDISLSVETNAQIYDHLKSIWAYVRTNGGKVIACTILPFGASSAYETSRQEINAWIRADSGLYDQLADFGNNSNIGEPGDQNNLTYYLLDKTHPNFTGNGIMANKCKEKINLII